MKRLVMGASNKNNIVYKQKSDYESNHGDW